MANNDEKLKLPIEGAAACPVCGSTERIGRKYFDELEAEGKVPKGSMPEGLLLQIPIMQALTGPLSIKPEIPVLVIVYDICGKCFTIYATKILLTKQPVQMQIRKQPPKGPEGPLPFLKG